MAVLSHSILKNRYEINQEISRGGMGRIFEGHDIVLDIKVAIKELFDNSYQSIEQFEREAKILARLNHTNLPRVTDFFEEKKKKYLVMDFIKGDDLQELIEKSPDFISEIKVTNWIKEVLNILEYIHNHGIVHRDVKPSNIKLTPEGKIILVDFGIAKIGINSMTSMGAQGFTPYMAPPEQYTGTGRTGIYSDIYAVGATIYYLLTRKLPVESIARLMGQKLGSPSKINALISVNMEKIIFKAMNIAPEERYKTAGEMKEAMELSIASHMPQSNQRDNTTLNNYSPIFRRDIRR